MFENCKLENYSKTCNRKDHAGLIDIKMYENV